MTVKERCYYLFFLLLGKGRTSSPITLPSGFTVSLLCKKAEEIERKQNRIYYRKPRSEMGVTCVGRQKMKLGSKPLYEG
ncbi:hypothetical protein [Escherichia coli]|uniref:hypothetical protein n=1 Tax=Escherichia coli TaxID=562 RepID=UPI003F54F999